MTAGVKVVRHIFLNVTLFVYIWEVKVRLRRHTDILSSFVIFLYITWPPEAGSSAIIVYMWRPFWFRSYWSPCHICITWLWRYFRPKVNVLLLIKRPKMLIYNRQNHNSLFLKHNCSYMFQLVWIHLQAIHNHICNCAQPEDVLIWAETCGCDCVLKINFFVWHLCICIFPYKRRRDKPL